MRTEQAPRTSWRDGLSRAGLDYLDGYVCSPGLLYSDVHERRAVGTDCAQAALPIPGESPAITENVILRCANRYLHFRAAATLPECCALEL